MKNTLFEFTVPANFQHQLDKHASVRYEVREGSFEVQPPFLTCSLCSLTDLEEQTGDTQIEKYATWTEGYQTEVYEQEESQFQGRTAYRINAKSDAEFAGQELKVTYQNFALILNEDWFVDLQLVYETKDAESFSSVLDEVLASLQVKGTAKDWEAAIAEDERELDQQFAVQQALVDEPKPAAEVPSFQIPSNGKEQIQIGDFAFEFFEEECKWNTVEFSKKLYVQVQAKTGQVKQAEEAGLTAYAYQLNDGEVKLSFDCSNIFQAGVPTGELNFEDGKTGHPQFIHFRAEGIDLDFSGKVTLKEGWVALEGVLKKSYQDEPSFPIRLCKKLPTQGLDWTLYQFTLAEALQTDPETVLHLWVDSAEESTLPPEVLDFQNLKRLIINSNTNNSLDEHSPLETIPAEIGHLKDLTELTITNTSVESLPESLGDLQNLTQLQISNNKLASLPKGIFNLPRLKYLWATRNAITSLPNEIDLPSLEILYLEKNALTTLPASLGQQPKLRRLALDQNPWRTLPIEVEKIKEIDLNINDKRRLLDFTYPGADGKGTIAWESESFLATSDSKLTKTLQKALKGTVLAKYQDGLKRLALKALALKTTKKDLYRESGNTRFGGLPDLPAELPYPTWQSGDDEADALHHIFIAQLNCADLAPHQDYLPRTGILYFFIQDEQDFAPKVIYNPGTENLISAQTLSNESFSFDDLDEPYLPYLAKAQPFVSLPHFYSDDYWYQWANQPELSNLEDYQHPDHNAFSEELRERVQKILGDVSSSNSINSYVFTQHESPQEQAALKLKGNPEDWVVLLKVTSDSNCGFCFWDAGELFFLIHKSDLAKRDFSNIYASIETS
ncbi:DUF1963 domain-containing protein [Roseibacillus persicicus]|uniref:DUF1963 domain-containing protein n=1 Tax=Roseibacillus persicicus TaxID=454148 RepID=UPI00280D9FE0|nr:DUF1963 domain-containing protein [Roseibacillus persicicus]MDQ8190109.1 DUF1963 domain-containing protein [Roseibacillus persicicus]